MWRPVMGRCRVPFGKCSAQIRVRTCLDQVQRVVATRIALCTLLTVFRGPARGQKGALARAQHSWGASDIGKIVSPLQRDQSGWLTTLTSGSRAHA